jgi:predicted aspartyl protease
MTESWNLRRRLIIVRAVITGPTGDFNAQMAVDTGASATLIDERVLRSIGYIPSQEDERVEVVDARGAKSSGRLSVNQISALGTDWENFLVVYDILPDELGIDGLLGLNFFLRQKLIIDFDAETITLEAKYG